MDLYCLNCGEPWDIFYVNDEKHEFEFAQENTGKITACPSCHGKKVNLSPKEKGILESRSHIADLLGDDIDGLASLYEDFEGFLDGDDDEY